MNLSERVTHTLFHLLLLALELGSNVAGIFLREDPM